VEPADLPTPHIFSGHKADTQSHRHIYAPPKSKTRVLLLKLM